ncbi:cupin superfamily protein [Pseudomonas aeruginosa]|nr:cupin superfamily protein [Pseudomonas aeruginosa]
MAITAIRHGITLDELDAWGSVADLGSEILEGEVKAFGKMTAGAPPTRSAPPTSAPPPASSA